MKNLLFAIQILFIVFLVGCTNKVDYVGELKNEKPHGKGSITYENGESYEGEWKDGLKDGKGTLTKPAGDKYEGEWKDDKMEGQGTYTWSNGDKYEGEWKDGKNMDKVIYFLKMEVKWSVSSKMIVPRKLYFMTNMLIFPPPIILLV